MIKIILIGYMGSGKTQTAAELSRQTGCPWMDLDALIEKDAQMTVSEIFKNEGEIKFRKREHALFVEMMESDRSFILALGGGTPCYANNHQWLNKTGVVSVYLKASIEELHRRLLSEIDHRPLLADKSEADRKEFIAISLFERSYFYNMAAHKIDTDGKSVAEVAREIASIIS